MGEQVIDETATDATKDFLHAVDAVAAAQAAEIEARRFLARLSYKEAVRVRSFFNTEPVILPMNEQDANRIKDAFREIHGAYVF